MKKSLLVLLLFSIYGSVSAQTVLNRFPLKLEKSSSYFQIIAANNNDNEYFAFITDKQKNTVIKYNPALFFSDSIAVPRPDKQLDFMAGVTFTSDGNPKLYWSSNNYDFIATTTFDFKNHSTMNLRFKNDFSKEKIMDVFVAANTFNIVSITTDNKLKITNFSAIGKQEYLITLSETLEEQKNLLSAILENGITKVETNSFIPLFEGVAKVKRYITEDKNYVLGIEQKNATVLVSVNLIDLSMQKDVFTYDVLNKNAGYNSFLHQNILYQLAVNSEKLSLSGKDISTKQIIGTYKANSAEEIDFKNSPLLLQRENSKARELKNTDKLLSKLSYKNVGLSIYATPNYNIFTIGGIREVTSGGNVAFAVGLGFVSAVSGADYMYVTDNLDTNFQSLFFESFFDSDFKHLKVPFRPMYIDALNEFNATNRVEAPYISHYQNFVILNYYDSKNNEFVMRRFEDIAY